MKVKVRAWLAFSGVLLALGCGSVEPVASERTEHVAQPVLEGTLDREDTNVFLLVTHRDGGVGLCTASLLAPNLLLTARHCVSAVSSERVVCGETTASAPFAVAELFATNSVSQDDVNSVYRVSRIDVPESDQLCGNDVALVTLSTLVPAASATPIVPRIDRDVVAQETYRAVGYGLDQPSDDGSAGMRRERSDLVIDCAPGSCGSGTRANEFVGNLALCSGDSGGPALDPSGKLLGVGSRSGSGCSHPVYGSVVAWAGWIREVAARAALRGNYEAPFWVATGQSSPSTTTQGDRCAGPDDCGDGFGCYSPTQSTTDAYCAGLCSDTAGCASGTHCDVGPGVCVRDAAAAEPSSSCAVGRAAAPSGAAYLACLGLLLVALGRRAGQKKSAPGGDTFYRTDCS